MATIERRRFPRVEVELLGEMISANGEELPAAVDNISIGGIQLRCDAITALRMTPRGHLTSKGDRVDFDVRLQLDDGVSSTLSVRCRVIFCHRVAQHDYRMGLEFIDLDTERSGRVEQFIVDRLQWD